MKKHVIFILAGVLLVGGVLLAVILFSGNKSIPDGYYEKVSGSGVGNDAIRFENGTVTMYYVFEGIPPFQRTTEYTYRKDKLYGWILEYGESLPAQLEVVDNETLKFVGWGTYKRVSD